MALFKNIQRLYRKNRSRAAKLVLSGEWNEDSGGRGVSLEVLETFWRPLLEKQSVEDRRRPLPVRDEQWGIVKSIDLDDLTSAIKDSDRNTAAGPDGRTLKSIAEMSPVDVLRQMNLWLVSCSMPTDLCEARTTLIPKVVGATEPSKFRPITVSSLLTRLYHRIVAKRIEALCPCSERQKAFRRGDGIAENVFLVDQLIRDHTLRKTPKQLFLCFLDVAKAFDSVSHESLLAACSRAGIPSPLLAYISSVYSRSTTRLWVNGEKSEPIACRQGVRQGDPLSSMLFNFVVDWALSSLDPAEGASIGKESVTHGAFADDQFIASDSITGLEKNVERLVTALRKAGLSLNAAKSATVAIKVDTRRRRWYIDETSIVKIEGEAVPGLKASEYYKYLGLHLRSSGATTTALERLSGQLGNLSRAPLKPQQRLYILKTNVIPGLLHQLVLGRVRTGFLRNLDAEIRKSVRRWLKFPHDLHLANFYARVKDGGLGIKSLEFTIPILKQRRMLKARTSADPVVSEATQTEDFDHRLRYWTKPRNYNGHSMDCKQLQELAWSLELVKSTDGKGLRHALASPTAQKWVSDGSTLMSGHRYCAALNLRAGTLPSGVRLDRGRNTDRRYCSAKCGGFEFLGHILQSCPRTHGGRVERHNQLVSLVRRSLRALKYNVITEQRIDVVYQGASTFRKPDIVFWNEDRSGVLDVSVHQDNLEDPNGGHSHKVDKYSEFPEIVQYVKQISRGVTPATIEPEFTALAVNWRGIINPQSEADLRRYGFRTSAIKLLAVRAVEYGTVIHRQFNTSTATYRRTRQRARLGG